MELQIDPEFHKLIPPLTPEEYAGLEASILSEGCRDALVVWYGEYPIDCRNCHEHHDDLDKPFRLECIDGDWCWECNICGFRELAKQIILDGHNRYEICKKHDRTFYTETLYLDSRDDAKEWIIKNQFGRRNLSAFDKAVLALKLEDVFKARAKENQLSGLKQFQNDTVLQNSAKAGKINTNEELAKIAGVSHDTISRVEKIKAEATTEQIERLKSKEASINEVYNEIKNRPHVSSNSGNNEWYTPSEYIESARIILGKIDLDPASSDLANTIVKADTYYTIENDGLCKQWAGKVWMNPPYSTDLVSQFINKLVESYDNEQINEAVVLVNNATETKWFQSLASIASAICFTYGRVKYWCPEGCFNTGLQGQAIVYIGNNPVGFGHEFSKHGWVTYFIERFFPENI